MQSTILGLDIGGANLKAATPEKRAVSVPFALWKQPDRLPAALAELVARFPETQELAVTMTGELCDCYETKRDGVNGILTAVQNVSRSRPIRVWSTDGTFLSVDQARANYLKVAAANWHALATLAGQYVPESPAVLVDVGSTTTDVIPILNGRPVPDGLTDYDRISSRELLYTGVRRTPVCAILGFNGAAEFFATTLDVYLTLGILPEDPNDTDTADGRPATRPYARDRLCRMLGGDRETIHEDLTRSLAEGVYRQQCDRIAHAVLSATQRLHDLHERQMGNPSTRSAFKDSVSLILSGSGDFLARQALRTHGTRHDRLLNEILGPDVSACAPAYAVAVLASEQQQPPPQPVWPPWKQSS